MSRMPEKIPTEGPKTFISYSWSSPQHEAWVIDLPKQLVEFGVQVILDKWDLREGSDKYRFMEQMVTDPNVRKVVVVCDRMYAEKADGREGGVGTETQIMSGEIYNQVDPNERQLKFVAAITEKDDGGKPYVPTFLKNRIYIDMTPEVDQQRAFEQLVRWIYDKPIYLKPELGKPPAYLFENTISLGTTAHFRRALSTLKDGRAEATGSIIDYFDTLVENFERFRLSPDDNSKEFDDRIVESIDAFLSYRNEVIEIMLAVAKYQPNLEGYQSIHRFLERLLPFGFIFPKGQSSVLAPDNFRFIVHEIFLYAIAALLKYERFDGVRELLHEEYFFPAGAYDIESGMVAYTKFRHFLRSLDARNNRLQLHRLSVTADLLERRAKTALISFDDLMEADFVSFLCGDLRANPEKMSSDRWWPDTLLYADRHHGAFEIFARAQSSRYFANVKNALGIESKTQLEQLLQRYHKRELKLPKWEFESFSPWSLMNIEKLDSRP